MTEKSGQLNEAIEVLKTYMEVRRNAFPKNAPDVIREAIDTVVSHYEKSEKVDFLKSAKQPSEITHPYDLSKNRRQRNNHDGYGMVSRMN